MSAVQTVPLTEQTKHFWVLWTKTNKDVSEQHLVVGRKPLLFYVLLLSRKVALVCKIKTQFCFLWKPELNVLKLQPKKPKKNKN